MLKLNPGNEFVFKRRLRILSLIAFLILIWIIVIRFFSGYVSSGIDSNWDSVSSEKINKQKEIILNLYGGYCEDISNLSKLITESPEILKQIQRSDSKKLFEEILKLNINKNYQVEIYNTRLELLAFKGRKLDSDIFSLQKCLNGKNFSVIKEIGFYTFLIEYLPVYDVKDKSQITGVLLTSKFIDIKYLINNKFFQNAGLLNDIYKNLGFIPQIFTANVISGKISIDSSLVSENEEISLKGFDGNVIGIIMIPKFVKSAHEQDIELLTDKIISMLVFGMTVILFFVFLILLTRVNSLSLKFILFVLFLAAVRYAWIEFHFPSKILELEIFSPVSYASVFGFGLAKSTGELLITSMFLLLISVYGVILISRKSVKYNPHKTSSEKLILFSLNFSLVVLFFALIFLFGTSIQSIIFDSNLKFFDKASIIPNFELFSIQLIILILAFSLFLFLSSIVILILNNSVIRFFSKNVYRKYSFVLYLLTFIIISELASPYFDNFRIDFTDRILIIVFSFGFGFYAGISLFLRKKYVILSAKSISVLIMFCTITVPGILLDKISSQETEFVELIGKKTSERSRDKIKFMLMTELSALSDDVRFEKDIINKSKITELAFSVWAESKFSEENFNTAVIILDTNKKILSDFIFNSQLMYSDSIVNFAGNKLAKIKIKTETKPDTLSKNDSLFNEDILEEDEEYYEEKDITEEENLFISDKILILENNEDKYYLGVVPIEKVGLKNTAFATIMGYLMVAVQYESKNLQVQSSLQLFKNYSKDNFFEKLISDPIITEYVNGEIVSSTNQDLSKTNTLSLDAFRESVKDRNEKNIWRYEIINNEKYRTFYILADTEEGSGNERIYSISLKRSDFKLITFFYLKFILFTVFIYLIIMLFYSVFMILKIRKFRLNFREKLFASFFIVSIIPIILLAFYTRSFIKNKYDSNFQNQIISDLNLVSQGFKGIQVDLNSIDTISKERNKFLTKALSNTDKNFNLFVKTRLVSTTNEELYKSDLLDTRVDADAYYNIVFLRKDFYSKTEEIGVYSFIVGYKPFFDSRNNIVGLMSSQTVYKQNEIKEELTEILTFIFGIYLIVIIVLLILVIYLTDRISKPILRLQYATEKIAKGESNADLKVDRKDEIGNLINSFNKMTRELESSKEKLKKAEREAAWRDIARRVAHEIKNPLTPMKLSIEHLYEVYGSNKNNFAEILKKTRNIIIMEIDKLNRIATEFSDFAKLSGRNYVETNLNEVIEEVVSLYKLAPEIEFKENLDRKISPVYADKQELNRVFQNLIKNSIQSISGKGKIVINTYMKNEFVCAEVTDNGCGIDATMLNNLFEPNFSTKSTGMGLGLAIAKKSLDDMKAVIRFDSKVNEGTKVTLTFIAYNPSDGKEAK